MHVSSYKIQLTSLKTEMFTIILHLVIIYRTNFIVLQKCFTALIDLLAMDDSLKLKKKLALRPIHNYLFLKNNVYFSFAYF